MDANEAYELLAKNLGHEGSKYLRAILEHLMTPDQAVMAASLPGTAAEVAEKTDFAEGDIQEALDELFFKGVVFPRGDFVDRKFFRFARYAMQLHDATQATQQLDVVKDKDFYQLWHDFCLNEMYPTMGRFQDALPQPPTRIVPAYKALEGLPDVHPSEDYRELMKAQELIAVVPCSCRLRTTSVDEHCEVCSEEERWNCLQFGRAADYVIKRGSGKQLSVEEALELVDVMEDDGLLHIWGNTASMVGVKTSCNCCRDCCMNYVPMDMIDASIGKIWQKSRYEAVIDQEKCEGCQDCIERCLFDAIDLVQPEKGAKKGKKAKKMKATVDPDKCWGCGVCIMACDEAKALTFKQVRPLDFIPSAT